MKRLSRCLVLVLLATGCVSRYPMGLSREQWESLPPEEQAEYQAKQFVLDEQRRQAEEARRAEQARLAAEAARIERERIRQLYASARYGDIVRVSIQGGQLEIYGHRYPYHPVSFELVRGQSAVVEVTRVGRVSQVVGFDVRLSDDANMIYFDDFGSDAIVLANVDWERGQYYSPSVSGQGSGIRLVGATYFVKFKDLPGAPQRLIIERR